MPRGIYLHKPLLKEHKEHIREALKNRKFDDKWREKLSNALKGNKNSIGRILSDSHKRKLSKALEGNKNAVGKGTGFKKGNIPWNKGKKCPQFSGKNNFFYGKKGNENHNWRGGTSFEPYGIEFNSKLKERIRSRDNYKCRVCGTPQLECIEKLHIHHIDYNKKNNELNNLISLCRSCHLKTNYCRKSWIQYFWGKLNTEQHRHLEIDLLEVT